MWDASNNLKKYIGELSTIGNGLLPAHPYESATAVPGLISDVINAQTHVKSLLGDNPENILEHVKELDNILEKVLGILQHMATPH
jgi:hypothetical protein